MLQGTLVEADMYERGALGQYPPGWTCYVAERREVSPDSNYVESLLRAPRRGRGAMLRAPSPSWSEMVCGTWTLS